MRTCTIARLTVDRPHHSKMRRDGVSDWLRYRAEEIESEPNCYSLQGFRARILHPMMNRSWATLHIGAAGCLSLETRKRIAKWLRSRAKHIASPNAVFDGRWFTQEFSL